MRILYPKNPLNNNEADTPYNMEFTLLKSQGVKCSLFDYDELSFGSPVITPSIKENEVILYRGWMMDKETYQKLEKLVLSYGGKLLTNLETYLSCHYIDGWIDKISSLTPKTVLMQENKNLLEDIVNLNWGKYFVKDYVKSNSDEVGSIADSPEKVIAILGLIKSYRGKLEGGIALREVEDFNLNTEERFFVFKNKIFPYHQNIPHVVLEAKEKINSNFYTIDVIKNKKGIYRIIEIGDGQVSDKKDLNLDCFVSFLKENINE